MKHFELGQMHKVDINEGFKIISGNSRLFNFRDESA